MPRISGALDIVQVNDPAAPVAGRQFLYFKNDGILYTKNASGVVTAIGSASSSSVYTPFSITGTLTVTTYTSRMYFESSATIQSIRASVGTAPTGASVIVDVRKNGTSLFTNTPANRPTIIVSGFTALSGARDSDAIAAGDYLTIAVTQVGSTVAGSDATVTIKTV